MKYITSSDNWIMIFKFCLFYELVLFPQSRQNCLQSAQICPQPAQDCSLVRSLSYSASGKLWPSWRVQHISSASIPA